MHSEKEQQEKPKNSKDGSLLPNGSVRTKARRGFACMPKDKVKAAGRKGGFRAHELGHAHTFTREEAKEAGKKGGEAKQRRIISGDNSENSDEKSE